MNVGAMVRSLAGVLEWVEQVLIRILFIGLVVVVFAGVLLRYVFRVPLIWGEELSLFFFIWLGLLSASVAVRSRSHFRMAALVALLPPPVRKAFDVVTLLVMGGLTVVLAWQGFALAYGGLGEQAPALRVPMAWVYSAFPVGALSMLVFLLENILVGPPPTGGA
jgi:TRAP-type C4-dicarboxylate transport system permease small subunit